MNIQLCRYLFFPTEFKYYFCHILKAHICWAHFWILFLVVIFLSIPLPISSWFHQGGFLICCAIKANPLLATLLFHNCFWLFSEPYSSIWTLRLFCPILRKNFIRIWMRILVSIGFICFDRTVIFMILVFPSRHGMSYIFVQILFYSFNKILYFSLYDHVLFH